MTDPYASMDAHEQQLDPHVYRDRLNESVDNHADEAMEAAGRVAEVVELRDAS